MILLNEKYYKNRQKREELKSSDSTLKKISSQAADIFEQFQDDDKKVMLWAMVTLKA